MESNYNLFFPALNATLNSVSFVFLWLGFWAIKMKKDQKLHKFFMTIATTCSALFLTSYLWYHFHYTSPRFEETGFVRSVYFFVLITHVILAAVVAPLIIRLNYLAFKGDFVRHKKLAKWTWPIWIYVSGTGILVYLFLYIWFLPASLIGLD